MRGRHRSRRALTLVELLVALAIIGLLAALILPAVQAARATARRAQCLNQVRQVALGLHQYHDAQGHFPAGMSSAKSHIRCQFSSFLVHVLPFVEQNVLHEEISKDFAAQPNAFFPSPPHRRFSITVRLYACPNDARVAHPQVTHGNFIVGLTSYLGSSGANHLAHDGVFYVDSSTRMSEITDGTSNTLMLGERPPSPDFWYGWWYGGAVMDGQWAPDAVLGAAEINRDTQFLSHCGDGPHLFRPGKQQEMCDTLHYWSTHSDGAHFAMADGSVQFLTYASGEVLPKLATRAGGEAVSP